MAIGWFIIPYQVVFEDNNFVYRRVQICEDTAANPTIPIKWKGCEILGNRSIVKVKASDGVLDALTAKYQRLPKNILTASLSDLTAAAKTKIKDELLDMGYSFVEIKEKFGDNINLENYTLKDVLVFMARRCRKPRNVMNGNIIVDIVTDGEVRPCPKTVEFLDTEVQ